MFAGLRRFLWEPYTRALEKRPLVTKMCTASFLMGVGDVCAQNLEHFAAQRKASKEENNTEVEKDEKQVAPHKVPFNYNYARTARMACVGFILSGPMLHQWYKVLDRMVPGTGKAVVIKKIAADQLIYTPISLVAFLGILNVLEGKSLPDLEAKMKRDFFSILGVNWTVWPIAQYINFALIPSSQRVLYVTVLGIFWNSYLSYMGNK